MTSRRGPVLAAVLSWWTVALEGFDLVTFGAIIPTLLETGYLGMGVAETTFIATVSLLGVGIGASGIGPVADLLGRRVGLIGSVALFTVFTLLQPLSPSAAVFAGLRFVAGLGLGACMPVALATMAEVTPPRHRAKSATITMTGYHVGAVATSLAALAVLPHWQWLFWIGGALGLVLLPLLWLALPESRPAGARSVPRVPLSALVRAPYLRPGIGLWVGSFMGLLLVYGLLTWLPQIMRAAGYSLASSLGMLLIMNVGAVVGLLLAGWVADARGIKPATLVWYVVAAVFLALLSVPMTNTLLLNAVVFVAGVFVFSAQVLIYALAAHLHHRDVRATALGLTAGIGRLGAILGPLLTGSLVSAGLGHPWGFYVFALVALLAVAAIALVPRKPPVVEN